METITGVEIRFEGGRVLFSAKDLAQKYGDHAHLSRHLDKINSNDIVKLVSQDSKKRPLNTSYLTLSGMQEYLKLFSKSDIDLIQRKLLSEMELMFATRESVSRRDNKIQSDEIQKLKYDPVIIAKDQKILELSRLVAAHQQAVRYINEMTEFHKYISDEKDLIMKAQNKEINKYRKKYQERKEAKYLRDYERTYDSCSLDLQKHCIGKYLTIVRSKNPNIDINIKSISPDTIKRIENNCLAYFETCQYKDCQDAINILLDEEFADYKLM